MRISCLVLGFFILCCFSQQAAAQCRYFDPTDGCFYDLTAFTTDFTFTEVPLRTFEYVLNVCGRIITPLPCAAQRDPNPQMSIQQRNTVALECFNLGSAPGTYSAYGGTLGRPQGMKEYQTCPLVVWLTYLFYLFRYLQGSARGISQRRSNLLSSRSYVNFGYCL